MAKTVNYYHSLISPWSYLGGPRPVPIAAETGATVNVKPIDLSRVFPVSGGLPLAKHSPQRQAYRLAELKRWRDYLAMPLNLGPVFFAAAEGLAARVVIAARGRRRRRPGDRRSVVRLRPPDLLGALHADRRRRLVDCLRRPLRVQAV